MSTAAMIYPDKKVAAMICGKMQKLHPTAGWHVQDVPNGFAVRSKLAAQAGSATFSMKSGVSIPQQVPKTTTEHFAATLKKATAAKADADGTFEPKKVLMIKKAPQLAEAEYILMAAKTGNSVNVTLEFAGQSNAWINVKHKGQVEFIGKSAVVAYSVTKDKVMVLMTTAYAKKRGFI